MSHPDYVCTLRKSLYGLKHAPRAWHVKIAEYLVTIGFHMANADCSFHVHRSEIGIMVISICVDDVIIVGDSDVEVKTVKVSSNKNMR